ncbi:hypothetical protein QO010_004508 [Caulobacter ginsengisoli]|uniref:PEP-CTERM sorting domain-containing protein n=1 Tax=Caulobacter ginsengisoli TaxID=400775 RepID=A0ABU0J0H1_9CAUL|nr:hypothetical protein [Caulobacter ginsengisoli]
MTKVTPMQHTMLSFALMGGLLVGDRRPKPAPKPKPSRK